MFERSNSLRFIFQLPVCISFVDTIFPFVDKGGCFTVLDSFTSPHAVVELHRHVCHRTPVGEHV